MHTDESLESYPCLSEFIRGQSSLRFSRFQTPVLSGKGAYRPEYPLVVARSALENLKCGAPRCLIEVIVPAEDRRVIVERIFIPVNRDDFLVPLISAQMLAPDGLGGIAEAFRRNIQAVLSTATVPFHLANASVLQLRLQAIGTAERIRARTLVSGGTTEEEADQIAAQNAFKKFEAEVRTETARYGDHVLEHLQDALRDDEFSRGAAELLGQCAVLTWSALEVLAQDAFIELLNTKPKLTSRLFADESAKKLFQLKSINIDTIIENDFDLSRRMGHVIVKSRPIDSIPVMRTTFSALLPDAAALHAALSNPLLWTLNQRRHLIVHKRGVVDREYLEKTGEKIDAGTTLNITATELEQYLRAVIDFGAELLGGAERAVLI